MSKYSDASLILPEGAGRATGLLPVLKPTDGTGDFTVSRNTVCQEINSVGDSVDVAVNVPRYDFKAPYVVPVDNSYYAFNGANSAEISDNSRFNFGSGNGSLTYFFTYDGSTDARMGRRQASNDRSFFNYTATTGYWYFMKGGISLHFIGFTKQWVIGTTYEVTFTFENGVSNAAYIDGFPQVLTDDIFTGGVLDLSATYRVYSYASVTDYYGGGNLFKIMQDNYALSAQEVAYRYNGLPIPDKYVGANNVDIAIGWDFTNWTAETGTTIDDLDSFSTALAPSGILKDLSMVVGYSYRVIFEGTTSSPSTNIESLSGDVYGSVSGSFTDSFEFTAIDSSIVMSNSGLGTTDITKFELIKLGNTLNLSKGKTASTWYDLDHDIQGAVTGATLNDSTDFGNNVHETETCPVLLTEPGFTNYFINSATPVTQTITTVVGTEYTINCKGVGYITYDEVGGNGMGGTVTEVYPSTYTATATSVTVTLVGGHAFDFVQLSNTSYAMNHVPTAGESLTKALDAVTGAGVAATYNSVEGVLEVEMSALFDDGTFRYISISDGTVNNRLYIGYISISSTIYFNVQISGVTVYSHSEIVSDITDYNILKLKYKSGDYGSKINGVEVDSQSSGAGFSENILTTTNFNSGAGSSKLYARTKNVIVHNGITNY